MILINRLSRNGYKAATSKSMKRVRIIAGLPSTIAMLYIALFVVAFFAYMILWKGAPVKAADSSGYLRLAQDLKDLSIDDLQDRSAGYPLVMLITGSAETPTRFLFFAQMLFHFASIWLLALVLFWAGVSQVALRFFGGVLLLPPYMEASGYVLTESLTELLLAISLAGIVFWYYAHKEKWLIASAIALGYSAITRPANQALAFVLIAVLFLMPIIVGRSRVTHRSLKKAGLLLAGATIAIVGAYSLMNFMKFKFMGVTPLMGYNLSTRTVRVLEQLPNEYSQARDLLIQRRNAALTEPKSSHTAYQYIWTARDDLGTITGLKEPALSNYLVRMNMTLIKEAPLEYLQDVAWGMASYWFPSTRGLANFNFTPVQLAWAALHFVLLSVFALQLTVFLALSLTKKSSQVIFGRRGAIAEPEHPTVRSLPALAYALAGTMILYTMLLTCFLDVGQPRQRTSTEGLFIFMVFLGGSMWARLVSPTVARDNNLDVTDRHRKAEAWLRKEDQQEEEEEEEEQEVVPTLDRAREPIVAAPVAVSAGEQTVDKESTPSRERINRVYGG